MAWLDRSRKGGSAVASPNSVKPAPKTESSGIEPVTMELGRALLAEARQHRPGVLSSKYWIDRLMNWAAKDPAMKVQLFRFVDVFPMLKTPEMVHDYLFDYLYQPGLERPAAIDLGIKAGSVAKRTLARMATREILAVANHFIGGATPREALPMLKKHWLGGIGFSIDLLGEACVSQKEATIYQERYLDLMETLPKEVTAWNASPVQESDNTGRIPRTNVSIKISSLDPKVDALDFEGSINRLKRALTPILQAAEKHNVLVNFDMEQYALKELTLELFEQCCHDFDFPAGIALQAYLRSGEEDVRRIVEWTRRSGRQVTVRLVKGAYWDYEVIHAEQQGWPIPVWTSRHDTDACFERMTETLVDAIPHRPRQSGVKLALGSHNVRSIARALALLQEYGLPETAVEIQMLHGMADQLKAAVLKRGLRLREYVPVGELVPGMAYFVRRLLENTSNESWLRSGFYEQLSDEMLLASPHKWVVPTEITDARHAAEIATRHELSDAFENLDSGRSFFNCPAHDFSRAAERARFSHAVQTTEVPKNPGDATVEQMHDAVTRATESLPDWRSREQIQRCRMLVAAGEEMKDRADELAGILVREAGKTWREADADVREAIDFCEYYARQAMTLLGHKRVGNFVGESNETWYQPRGVAAVISPWNFPLAICTGMTAAALVTGNTTIVKPASATVGTARVMCEAFWRAGVPHGALQLLPGSGAEIGAALVRDPHVHLIAFTGSKEVGLDILQVAGQAGEEQGFLKKVVCEMGGKNAIIVDESADLDEAVLGVRHSAFSYAGQKCSACSRVIVMEGVHDLFLERLIEASRALVVGDPADPATDVGPLIDERAAAKVRNYIDVGKEEGSLCLACPVPEGLEAKVGKPFVGPHIFSEIRSHHHLANEEIFGPVLSVMRVGDFERALHVANASKFKLTGGLYSRKPSHLARAKKEFQVGNLYLNRGITGALVTRQPFGGMGLSGTGTKAGGPDYLLHFVNPIACCENTMRHGFAPGLD